VLEFKFDSFAEKPKTILCLGAHSDDIEIGCGGAMLRLLEDYPNTKVHWIVLSSNNVRQQEAAKSAALFLEKASTKNIVVQHFKDGYFPYQGAEIKDYFEELKKDVSPDLVFTHHRKDRHQDHRLVCELTWNTFRNHLILEYEIPKYEGDLGTPNFYIQVPDRLAQQKTNVLLNCFETQKSRAWFTKDTFLSLMRIRGVEANASENYAEAFYCEKILF
jgi:LmbE family N-acetylglucosaminyl deacetylase